MTGDGRQRNHRRGNGTARCRGHRGAAPVSTTLGWLGRWRSSNGRFAPDPSAPLDVLAKVGGFEIGGLVGLMLGAAKRRLTIVVDGLISTAAALLAVRLSPAVQGYLIAGHRSVEPGHGIGLDALGLERLLALELRLSEGSGAALAVPIIRAAARTLAEMATFEEAAVSPRADP